MSASDNLNASDLPESIAADSVPPASVAPLYSKTPDWRDGRRHLIYVRESDKASQLQYAAKLGKEITIVPDDAADPAAWLNAEATKQAEWMGVYKAELARGEAKEKADRQARIDAALEKERQRLNRRFGR